MFRIVIPWILGTCLITVNLLFVAIAAMAGWLPAILRFIHSAFRTVLVWSYHVYRTVLNWVDPIASQFLGIHLTLGFLRIFACGTLSLLVAGLVVTLTPLNLSWWGIGLALLHGTAVGYLWGDVLEPGGLHLGSRLQ